jgi:sec-independent protein translocase protein TatC
MTPSNLKRAQIEDVDEDGGARMGFLDHLDELRMRLIRSCVAIGAGMAVSVLFLNRLEDVVLTAVQSSLPAGSSLIYTRPGEGFAFYFDLSLMGGLVVAAPFVTYQVWRFIAPGLLRNEKRLVIPFLVLAGAGSIAGALFSHYVLFPGMMAFFGTFDSPRMRFMPRVEDTFALYKSTLIGMVAVFQIPTLVFVLARLGLVSARFLWRHLSYAVLAAVVASALLTPSTDPWNQIVFAAPMVAMYVMGIGIAWLAHPKANPAAGGNSTSALGLVVATSVFEQARRRRDRASTARQSRLAHSSRQENG